ncbi:MAG: 1-(5-phosphoribosyl)-5-[(5-phosphoribosylamino)methylideneamino]imidazole-4-carboxamide isomerase [Bacteroidales bacterium]|nr:1-(5-phosphoribosyl)-5-[(5-phosphoribosylamino)methylideneamino]imidazole-4-carboxamide isomerase [Bacteroidales bacterium]
MLKIFPAIDIIDGKCVRLTKGDYSQKKIYNTNPLEVAKQFEDAGLQYLHLVDLDGAKEKRVVNHNILEKITSKTSLLVDFGGGIQSEKDIEIIFDCGANQVNIGSMAMKQPELFKTLLLKYSNEKIILSADVKDENIAIHGWQEETKISIFDFIKSFESENLKFVTCTDISKDGMLEGPSFDLYKKITATFPGINLTASGGISSINDIEKISEQNIYGVIIGKAIYEGAFQLSELKRFL